MYVSAYLMSNLFYITSSAEAVYYHAADKLVLVLPCRAVTLQYNLVDCAASVYFLQEGAEGGGNI